MAEQLGEIVALDFDQVFEETEIFGHFLHIFGIFGVQNI